MGGVLKNTDAIQEQIRLQDLSRPAGKERDSDKRTMGVVLMTSAPIKEIGKGENIAQGSHPHHGDEHHGGGEKKYRCRSSTPTEPLRYRYLPTNDGGAGPKACLCFHP